MSRFGAKDIMILCFDIGGARIRAALADGETLHPLPEVATPANDLAALMAAVKSFDRPNIDGVAISIAGAVDPVTGIANIANIPCLNGRDLGMVFHQALGARAVVLNDADSFALAEAVRGAGRGAARVFAIILGSGVGGGLVLNGTLLQGAGEWGHGPVIHDPALPCGCGQTGCLDTIGGARGLERLHLHLTGVPQTATAILADWAAHHATIARWVDLVSGPLAMAINLLGADIVPVGGGLSNAPRLIAALDTAVRARILRQTTAPIVICAQISADAGLIGAAIAGQRHFTAPHAARH